MSRYFGPVWARKKPPRAPSRAISRLRMERIRRERWTPRLTIRYVHPTPVLIEGALAFVGSDGIAKFLDGIVPTNTGRIKS